MAALDRGLVVFQTVLLGERSQDCPILGEAGRGGVHLAALAGLQV